MMFRVCAPSHPILRSRIRCYWYIRQTREEAAFDVPRMTPDGEYHLVVNLGSPHSFTDSRGRVLALRRSHINANQYEHATILRSGEVEVMGVIFYPYGLAALLPGISMHEITKSLWNLEDLFGRSLETMEDRLREEKDVSGKFRLLENEWLQRISDAPPVRAEVRYAANALMAGGGRVPIRLLAEHTQLGERSLERQFLRWVGVSPKHFSRLRRIKAALVRPPAEPPDLAELAARLGFYDQAHFHKEFRALTGVTPASFFRGPDSLSALFAR